MVEIILEPEEHRYFAIGETRRIEIPGVSFLLDWAKRSDSTWFKPWHAQRGTMIHRACTLDDQGVLDESTLDARIGGAVEAWRKLKRDLGITVLAMEYIIYDLGLGYAGTADRRLLLRGRTRPVTGDLKGGSKAKSHRLQLAAYVRGDRVVPWRDLDGMVVYLGADGRPNVDFYEGPKLAEAVNEWEHIVLDYHAAQASIW